MSKYTDQGYNAFYPNATTSQVWLNNPYRDDVGIIFNPSATDKAKEWDDGWFKAEAEYKQSEQSEESTDAALLKVGLINCSSECMHNCVNYIGAREDTAHLEAEIKTIWNQAADIAKDVGNNLDHQNINNRADAACSAIEEALRKMGEQSS